MKTVYKYSLETDFLTIDVPIGSKVVCVHEQNGTPTIWIEQETDKPMTKFAFAVFGTGRPVPEDGIHIGTCFIGPNVWHVYQKV